MKDLRAASKYARAFYLALKNQSGTPLLPEIEKFSQIAQGILSSGQLWSLLMNAFVPLERKREFLRHFLQAQPVKLSAFGVNFLNLLLINKRIYFLPQVLLELQQESDLGEGKINVTVRSAIALSTEKIQKIEKMISEITKKKVVMICTVQPDLLAGTIVQAGDLMIDKSLKSQLKKLKKNLR